MNILPVPVGCECGFTTMNAAAAIKHIKEKHPEMWIDWPEDYPHDDCHYCQRHHALCADCNNRDLYLSPDKEVEK